MKAAAKISVAIAITLSLGTTGIFSRAQAAAYATVADDSLQDFHIDKDGNVNVRQVKVVQISGTSFYVRYYFGLAFIRMLIKTDQNTKVFRRFGDEIPLNQITVGDILNVEGKIESGADSLSVIASKITNFSNQKEIGSFQGIIVGTGSTTGSFILSTKNGIITVTTGTTTQIKKGNRIINPDMVKNGDTVTDIVGTYDHASKTLDAYVITVYIDMRMFAARNFQGTLKTVSFGNPTTLTVNAEGKDYTLMLRDKTEILNKTRKPVSIKRYIEGDTVRFYGAVREGDDPIIDAEVVRNLSLQ